MLNQTPKVGIGIIVFRTINNKQHIMMHQRKGNHGPGYWGSGGGHLEVGESLFSAALRELREEAGDNLKVANLRLAGIVNFTDFQPKHYVDITFAADWVSGEPINGAPDETTDWQWIAIDQLPSPLFPPLAYDLEMMRTGELVHDSSFTETLV